MDLKQSRITEIVRLNNGVGRLFEQSLQRAIRAGEFYNWRTD